MDWLPQLVFVVLNSIAITAICCHPDKAVPISRPGLIMIAIGDLGLLYAGGFFS